MAETTQVPARELLDELKARGLLEFGSVISGHVVRGILGLEMPERGTKEEFDAVALRELSAVDYVRDKLLNEGKYLRGVPSGYRVLMPSENEAQVHTYMTAAESKLARARRLWVNTPTQPSGSADQTAARLLMQSEAVRRRKARHA